MSTRSLNKVQLIGNVTRDPELRYTPQGTAVCSFGLATNRSWLPEGSTERREEAEFHKLVAWNKLAELCSQLITKGRKIYVEGRLQTRSWETPDGEKRQSTEIVVEDMMLLDARPQGEMSPKVEPVKEKEEKEVKADEAKGGQPEDVKEAVKESDAPAEDKTKKEDKKSDEIDLDDIPF
ncbi:MAG TPA: single-stranded DNA-binding protein [Patescibacteria group bacterium]|nr:single-stranded DNA-binding protein [Patescibacteria group bacterium]